MTDQAVLADYAWKRQFVPSENSVFYRLDFDDNYYLFELSLPEKTPTETTRQCQAAAEAVIATFKLADQTDQWETLTNQLPWGFLTTKGSTWLGFKRVVDNHRPTSASI